MDLKLPNDDEMRTGIASAKHYTACILRKTAKMAEAETLKIVWEHGRRNFGLRDAGALPIVCPINDGSEVSGIGIFALSVAETKAVMDEDPGIKAGIFTYELHECRGFPGSVLP